MSDVEWAVIGYDKSERCGFVERREDRGDAEYARRSFYSSPSQYRDVRVVCRTAGEWADPDAPVEPAREVLTGSLTEAEDWLRRIAGIAGPEAGSRKALVLIDEYGRLKAIDAALGPVIERLAEMDDEDFVGISCATSRGFAESLAALLKSAVIVVRAEAS